MHCHSPIIRSLTNTNGRSGPPEPFGKSSVAGSESEPGGGQLKLKAEDSSGERCLPGGLNHDDLILLAEGKTMILVWVSLALCGALELPEGALPLLGFEDGCSVVSCWKAPP